MRRIQLSLLLLFYIMPAPAIAQETRCGWLDNPSPANVFLIDKDQTWTLIMQGAPLQTERGTDTIYQALSDKTEYIYTHPNRSYGFSCACLTGDTADKGSGEFINITHAKQKALKWCYADKHIAERVPYIPTAEELNNH